MRIDHRRPLAAYVLVTVACAFVVAPSLDLGGLGLGQKPTFSAFSDTTMTPSEAAERIVDPTNFDPAPHAEVVEPPVTDDEEVFAPGLDAIEDVLDEPLFESGGSTADDSGSQPQGSDDGGSQPVAEPRSDLVNAGGPTTDGGAPTGGDQGGPATPANPSGPDTTDGSGVVDGAPPADGGPAPSPAEGGGPDAGDAPGPENGPEHGNGHGTAAPVPHSFDHVPPGDHPNGQVGPPPGHGPQDDDQRGPQDKGPQDKDQGKAPQDKGPQGEATGHGKGHGRARG